MIGQPRKRAAFTLLELMIALSLGALLLIAGRLLFEQLDLAAETLRREAARADEAANGSRLLRALVSTAEAGSDTTQRFSGDERNATFATWCEVPAGWLERCTAHLGLTTSADSTVLAVTIGSGTAFPIWRTGNPAHLRYYGHSGGSLGWLKSWGTSIAAPLALALVTESAGDTVVVPVGAGP